MGVKGGKKEGGGGPDLNCETSKVAFIHISAARRMRDDVNVRFTPFSGKLLLVGRVGGESSGQAAPAGVGRGRLLRRRLHW